MASHSVVNDMFLSSNINDKVMIVQGTVNTVESNGVKKCTLKQTIRLGYFTNMNSACNMLTSVGEIKRQFGVGNNKLLY